MNSLTDKQKAELGSLVAELKTLLHDTENKITNNQLASVDWRSLLTKVKNLGWQINDLLLEEEVESVPTPTPPSPPPAQKSPAPRRK